MEHLRTVHAAALAAIAATATLAGCAHRADSTPAAQQSSTEKPPVAVSVSPVATAELVEAVEVVGALAPKFAADVKSEITGVVEAVHVTEWVPVRKNAELARLDTAEMRAGIEALRALEAQARVAEARARREHERGLQLRQYGLITPQALDDAKTAVDAAEAATAAARAQVRTAEARLAKSSIRAPMDGVVAQRFVSVGDRVENVGGNTPMFRIVDNRLLEMTVAVPTPQLPLVRVGQPLEFTTDAVPGRVFEGKVMFINPAVDESNRSAKVVCDVPNTGSVLKGGLFVKGRIITGRRPGVLQVPREAVLNWDVAGHRADLFIVSNGIAARRTVKTGVATAATVEIVSGVGADSSVVTRGGFALRDGDRVVVAKPERGA